MACVSPTGDWMRASNGFKFEDVLGNGGVVVVRPIAMKVIIGKENIERDKALALSVIILTGMVSGSRNERTLKRLLASRD
jgi:hypothetical protein